MFVVWPECVLFELNVCHSKWMFVVIQTKRLLFQSNWMFVIPAECLLFQLNVCCYSNWTFVISTKCLLCQLDVCFPSEFPFRNINVSDFWQLQEVKTTAKLQLLFVLVIPYILTFIVSLFKTIFSRVPWPSFSVLIPVGCSDNVHLSVWRVIPKAINENSVIPYIWHFNHKLH